METKLTIKSTGVDPSEFDECTKFIYDGWMKLKHLDEKGTSSVINSARKTYDTISFFKDGGRGNRCVYQCKCSKDKHHPCPVKIALFNENSNRNEFSKEKVIVFRGKHTDHSCTSTFNQRISKKDIMREAAPFIPFDRTSLKITIDKHDCRNCSEESKTRRRCTNIYSDIKMWMQDWHLWILHESSSCRMNCEDKRWISWDHVPYHQKPFLASVKPQFCSCDVPIDEKRPCEHIAALCRSTTTNPFGMLPDHLKFTSYAKFHSIPIIVPLLYTIKSDRKETTAFEKKPQLKERFASTFKDDSCLKKWKRQGDSSD